MEEATTMITTMDMITNMREEQLLRDQRRKREDVVAITTRKLRETLTSMPLCFMPLET